MNAVFLVIIVCILVGAGLLLLKKDTTTYTPKSGGQPLEPTPENPERHGSLDKRNIPTAE